METFETGAYFKGEQVICINTNTEDGCFTLNKFYTVLAYAPEAHLIMLGDDLSQEVWVEAENFKPEEFIDCE